MPGPRKNLTPLDMKMMGLAFNQGGVINFLGKQPEVTAPVRAQSHADSPPVQLAYITDAEKDLLVKSNIHGSMDGKPNPGPAGLPSLDDFFNIPGGGVGGGNVGTGQSYQSQSDYGIGAGQAVGGGQGGTGGQVFTQQNDGSYQQDNQATESAAQIAQNLQEKIAVEAAKKAEALAQTGAEQAETLTDTLLGRIKTKIMGGGEGGNLDLTKEEAYADLPAGMHPLRKQYEYLSKKYGENWKNTTQAKVLEGYLSGVPVERGGGLGAQDENYGLTGDEAKEFQSKLLLNDEFMDGQNYRNSLLRQVAGMTNTMGGQFDFSKIDPERASEGLSPEQYFNFRQQLMAADATPENQQYKSAFPFSSGSGLESLSRFIPGIGTLQTLAGGIFPERDLSGYQQNIDPIAAGFRPLPVPDQDQNNQTGPIRPPGFMPIIPFPQPEPERPRYPLPGDPKIPPFDRFPYMPDGGNFPLPKGINAFNPMFLGPSFRGSRYTNRGVSPAFYEALSRFA